MHFNEYHYIYSMAQTLTKYTTNQTISVYIAKLKNKFVQTQIFSENISNSKVMFAAKKGKVETVGILVVRGKEQLMLGEGKALKCCT